MAKPLDIIFAGTPDFAASALEALLGTEHRVVAVYAQPDRPAGRGRKLASGPVKQLALDHAIPLYQPKTLKDPEAQASLSALRADLMVVAAYGLLLPQGVLDAPRLGCINIHASLLPRWRGAAPIQRAILDGDAQTGITIMQMEAGLDTGPMLHRLRCEIHAHDTAGTLHDRLAGLGAQALLEVLPGLAAGSLTAEPQNQELATYAGKLDKREGCIDWEQSAWQIDRQVRAFNPWPVAHTLFKDKMMRIWSAQPVPGATGAEPGTVVGLGKRGIEVATGQDLLRIQRLQMPGKRAMSTAEFLNAHAMDGVVLG